MSLELYDRRGIWWFKGRIAELPAGKYYRQSLGAPRGTSEKDAARRLALFEADEIKRHYAGVEKSLTFAEAVLKYPATPADAKFLKKILPEITDRSCAGLTPSEIRALGPTLYPKASTATWMRQVVTPVRAVINNAADLKLCPPIRIRPYSKNETVRQDRLRGKNSGQKKTPGSWEWLDAFAASPKAKPRLTALAILMFTTGARVSQCLEIDAARDLDLSAARIRLPAAKGHPAEWVTLTPEAVAALANMPIPAKGRLFRWEYRSAVYRPWRACCVAAGIEIIMPHAAGRHGFGTEWIVRQGGNPVAGAKAGRWSSPTIMLDTYAHAGEVEQSRQQIMSRTRTNPVQQKKKGAQK